MSEHTIEATSDAILHYLNEKKLEAEIQAETGQPYIINKTAKGDFPIFFRIYEGNEQLQILTFFPLQIKKERYDTLARVLLQLNNDIDLPGFGLDAKMGLVFHRIMIPLFNSAIPQNLLDLYLKAIPSLCNHFSGIIKSAIESNKSADELLKRK